MIHVTIISDCCYTISNSSNLVYQLIVYQLLVTTVTTLSVVSSNNNTILEAYKFIYFMVNTHVIVIYPNVSH